MIDKLISGLKWSTVQVFATKGINFFIFLVVSRLLDPVAFGLMASVAILILICEVLFELGLGDALVQLKNINNACYDSVFSISITIAFALWILIIAIGSCDGLPDQFQGVFEIAPFLGVQLIFTSWSVVYYAMHRRNLDFKKLANRVIYSQLVSGVLALTLANLNFGVWALVAQSIFANFLSFCFLRFRPKYIPRYRISLQELNSLRPFAEGMLGLQVLGLIKNKMLDTLLGFFFGPIVLGFYMVGTKIVVVLNEIILGIVNNIGLPFASKIQHTNLIGSHKINEIVFFSFLGSTLFYMPIYFAANQIVVLFFNAKWIGADDFLAAASFGACAQIFSVAINVFVNALGRTKVSLAWEIIKLCLASVSVLGGFFMSYTPSRCVLIFSAAYYLLVPLQYLGFCRVCNISLSLGSRSYAFICFLTLLFCSIIIWLDCNNYGFNFILFGLLLSACFAYPAGWYFSKNLNRI